MQYSQKGVSGSPRSLPASAYLMWGMEAARNSFQAILRAVWRQR